MPGVVHTRVGWLNKEEVVEVIFDSRVTSFQTLLAKSRCVEKPSTAFTYQAADHEIAKRSLGAKAVLVTVPAKDAKATDRRYYLRRSPLWLLPLTDVQAVRANALLATKGKPRSVLSPSQLALLGEIESVWQDKSRRKALASLKPTRRIEDFGAYTLRLRAALKVRPAK